MNFDQAKYRMLRGDPIRRKAWREGVYISVKMGDRFVTLTIHFKALNKEDVHQRWEPYVKDFTEDDWEIYGGVVPVAPSRVVRSRYERTPVI